MPDTQQYLKFANIRRHKLLVRGSEAIMAIVAKSLSVLKQMCVLLSLNSNFHLNRKIVLFSLLKVT